MEYHLTDLDKTWWWKVKAHAARRGMSIKSLILWLLRKDMEQWSDRHKEEEK